MLSKWFSLICKCLGAAGCLALLLFALPAQAQAQLHFTDVKISLLPEYDQPSVLVIYRLSLAPATALPVQLKLTLPARAQVWAVAETDASGTLIDVAHTSQTQAGRTVLAFTSDSLSVHIEYYEPLVKNGLARHIAFEWPGDYAASALAVDFQLPAGATNLVLSPPSVTSGTDQGFTHYQTSPVSLAAGQSFSLTADYQRQSDALSAPTPQAPAAQPLPQNTLTKLWSANQTSILLGLLGALLLIGGLSSLVFWRRSQVRGTSRKRHTRAAADVETSDEVVFCSQCGTRALPGDTFCRECGTRLRRSE
jgi:ribosomal protein L32